ncbi:MAG: DUF3450 domain-containing protein [Xanthomonadaceae bacterium]|nr:DUF3450 domain-containing protein [Xanthomonadaceae bacterium]
MLNSCVAGLCRAALPALLILVAPNVGATPEVLRSSIQVQSQADAEAARSQADIDRMTEETRQMFDEYRNAMQEIEQLRIYNEQMARQVANQEREMASIQRQIDEFEGVERGITPLMVRMVDTLDRFVQLDAPFLPEERRNRVENVKSLMDDANVAVGERYRRLMEAYTIEMDYARNMDTYSGMLDFGGSLREVNFLRLGRLVLLYQTLDRSETGFWDTRTNEWARLGDEYRTPVNDGIRMAQRLAAPDLLAIPIIVPERN